MKKQKFQAPTGMHDILPSDQVFYRKVGRIAENLVDFYGFEKIDTPIVENAELFEKGTGLSTDVVQKQMYSFKTKGGDYLALRPEFTPGVVRAYIEHGMMNLPQPLKLWYLGPLFRYERPQAGRFRQFHQFGVEVIGEGNPAIDAQVIQIFYNLLQELKFRHLIVEVNSIGDNQCRPYYKKSISSYFKYREQQLCLDCKRRLRENPLRILDCKEEKCQRIINQAPQMVDYLCDQCKTHFKKLLEVLDDLNLPYHLNPLLVRGLDYYTKTVFEIWDDTEGGKALGAMVGGGRYDSLVKILGGKDTSACGGAAGLERIISELKARGVKPLEPQSRIFVAQLGDLAKRKTLGLVENFRKEGISIAESLGKDSLKTQLNRANKIGAEYSLIIGQKEALDGTVIVRDMHSGKQDIVRMEKVAKEMQRRLKK
ncbi:MAG: histidine--tRNA ligase [Candidatus Nealsonbacteria bacterium]|nr:histidine--tRNA ligase [Candidatus Nealsonbacteria bacterium]